MKNILTLLLLLTSFACFSQTEQIANNQAIDKEVESDPRLAFFYTVDETVGNLRLIRVMGPMILFSRTGKMPSRKEVPVLLIMEEKLEGEVIKDPEQFCLSRLADLPGDYMLTSEIYPRKANLAGRESYELLAVDNEKGEEVFMSLILGEDGGYFSLSGVYPIGNEEAKADVIAVMKTLRKQ